MWNVREELDQNGFAVLEDFLTEQDITELKDECANLINLMPQENKRTIFSTTNSNLQQNKDKYFLDSADKISYFFEADALNSNGDLKVDPQLSLNKIGHALHELNPVFRKTTFSPRIKQCCRELGFENPAVVQSMYNFKNPGVGSEVVVHQDAWYLYTEPLKLVGFWFALDDATLENGCLWFSKGSHKSGVHRRYVRNPNKESSTLVVYTSPPPDYTKDSFVSVPVRRGSCVIIHGQAVHYSERNNSTKPRHAYTFHVVEQNNTKYSEDNWLQLPENKSFLSLYSN